MSINFNTKLLKLLFVTLFVMFFSSSQLLQAQNMALLTTDNIEQVVDNHSDISNDFFGAEAKINQNFFINFLINLTAVLFILFFVYYPNYQKLDTIFTFIMFNVVIYLLTFVLNEVKISMGAAFGLFAVFSMLRYRTTSISMKDMTYLFIFIALGLLSAIQFAYYELIIVASIIFVAVLILDTNLIFRKEVSATLLFERIEMIKPEYREELMVLLKERTGINIHRVDISEIDFLKDTAIITYYYFAEKKRK